MNLDKIDLKILELLQSNSNITNAQLAVDVGISPPASLERVKRLEKSGIISRYVAILNPNKVGMGTLAFVAVSLAKHGRATVQHFTTEIKKFPQVLECYHIAGDHDFMLKVLASNIKSYEDFMLSKLTTIKGIDKIRTSFVLSTMKFNTKIDLTNSNTDQ